MGLFDNFKSGVLEEQARDYVGGFKVYDADIYEATIKNAFRNQSDGGAYSIVYEFLLPNNELYKEEIYFTNSKGEHWFMTKPTDGSKPKRAPMPGYTTVNNIAIIATGKELSEQESEVKTMKVYSSKEKRDVNKEVPVLVEHIGKKVCLGIRKILENKQEKGQDGKYHDLPESRESNEIHTIFHPELKVTVNEARDALAKGVKPEPNNWVKWLETNKGKVRDERKIKDGGGGTKPTGGGDGGSGGARKSLFG